MQLLIGICMQKCICMSVCVRACMCLCAFQLIDCEAAVWWCGWLQINRYIIVFILLHCHALHLSFCVALQIEKFTKRNWVSTRTSWPTAFLHPANDIVQLLIVDMQQYVARTRSKVKAMRQKTCKHNNFYVAMRNWLACYRLNDFFISILQRLVGKICQIFLYACV